MVVNFEVSGAVVHDIMVISGVDESCMVDLEGWSGLLKTESRELYCKDSLHAGTVVKGTAPQTVTATT